MEKQLYIILLACLFSTVSWAENKPYYTLNRTWALSTDPAYNLYPRSSFLPSRYLLYLEDRNDLKEISKQQYVKAITQDGVEVYVLSEYVSEKPFVESIGNHEVIFNSEFHLCRKTICDNPKESDFWPVSRGDAFSIEEHREDGLLKLKGKKDSFIFGFISQEKIEAMRKSGQITRTDQRHPRYRVNKTEIPNLTNRCNQKIQNNLKYNVPKNIIEFIVASFDLGVVQGDRLNISNLYGDDGSIYTFNHYAVTDLETSKNFEVAAIFKFACEKPQFADDKRLYIKDVTFKSSRKADQIVFSIDDEYLQTPKDLLKHTGAPYLISINTYSHFEKVIDYLSKKIDDRTLAGYALSELNVSCKFSERRKLNSPCTKYDYGN